LRFQDLLDRGSNAVFALAAAVIAVAYVVRAPGSSVRSREASEPRALFIDSWHTKLDVGIRLGPATSPLTIVEFMDFQCPFCRRFAAEIDSLRAEFPGVAIVIMHFPLSNHRFAVPAAIASECADQQERFPEMYSVLFGAQDSFGLKTWSQYASDAGVPDLADFERCISLPIDSFPRIAYGKALGKESGIAGTPGVWINGWQRPRGSPSLNQLRDSAQELGLQRNRQPHQ
jgi:protein-disulfide isomerase